jgi:hypothetical protein
MIRPNRVLHSTGLGYARSLGLAQTAEVLQRVGIDGGGDLLGEVVSAPGLLTASIEPTTGEPVGLHLDNWDKKPLALRADSSIRFAINRGPGWRGLWVGDHLSTWFVDPNGLPTTASLEGRLCSADCALLQVPVNCGYLARTEEILHDGTTLGADAWSRLITWLIQPGTTLYRDLDALMREDMCGD